MSHPAVEKIEAGDPLLDKFRSLFPDKSPTVLSNIFGEMTESVYKGKGEKEASKMSSAMKSRWGSIAAKFRSLNLIEFKIAMYRFKTQQMTFEEIRRIFLWLDSSGNGRVEYDEFVAGIRVRPNAHEFTNCTALPICPFSSFLPLPVRPG